MCRTYTKEQNHKVKTVSQIMYIRIKSDTKKVWTEYVHKNKIRQ